MVRDPTEEHHQTTLKKVTLKTYIKTWTLITTIMSSSIMHLTTMEAIK